VREVVCGLGVLDFEGDTVDSKALEWWRGTACCGGFGVHHAVEVIASIAGEGVALRGLGC
jgi:hypothetical protein